VGRPARPAAGRQGKIVKARLGSARAIPAHHQSWYRRRQAPAVVLTGRATSVPFTAVVTGPQRTTTVTSRSSIGWAHVSDSGGAGRNCMACKGSGQRPERHRSTSTFHRMAAATATTSSTTPAPLTTLRSTYIAGAPFEDTSRSAEATPTRRACLCTPAQVRCDLGHMEDGAERGGRPSVRAGSAAPYCRWILWCSWMLACATAPP
jgi:hypothetical protein